jgi:hypothetical protein
MRRTCNFCQPRRLFIYFSLLAMSPYLGNHSLAVAEFPLNNFDSRQLDNSFICQKPRRVPTNRNIKPLQRQEASFSTYRTYPLMRNLFQLDSWRSSELPIWAWRARPRRTSLLRGPMQNVYGVEPGVLQRARRLSGLLVSEETQEQRLIFGAGAAIWSDG